MKRLMILLFLLVNWFEGATQEDVKVKLVSGPMICGVTEGGACIWIQASSNIKKGNLRYWNSGDEASNDTLEYNFSKYLGKENCPVQIQLNGLLSNTLYKYQLELNGVLQDGINEFKTQKLQSEVNFDEFSFIIGSGHSAVDTSNIHEIFNSIRSKNPSFMVWAGSTMEYPQEEIKDMAILSKIYTEHRKAPKLQVLLNSIPHYAVWGESEYGKKGGDKNFSAKKESSKLFKTFWPNYTGLEKGPGTSSYFKWNDCEFYLMDQYSFRSPGKEQSYINNDVKRPNPFKRCLGIGQMEWLAGKLMKSTATYKFIIGGGEWLNTANNGKESLRKQYPIEYEELYNLLKDSKIKGVMFLSGGRGLNQFVNHTEDAEQEIKNFYLLSDYTCGPLTGKVDYSVWKSPERSNSRRIGGALIIENSFVQVLVSGPSAARRNLKFVVFDKNGYVKYKLDVPIYTLWHEYSN